MSGAGAGRGARYRGGDRAAEIVLFIMGGVFVMEAISVMVRSARSNLPAGACSAWRRCIITMS